MVLGSADFPGGPGPAVREAANRSQQYAERARMNDIHVSNVTDQRLDSYTHLITHLLLAQYRADAGTRMNDIHVSNVTDQRLDSYAHLI